LFAAKKTDREGEALADPTTATDVSLARFGRGLALPVREKLEVPAIHRTFVSSAEIHEPSGRDAVSEIPVSSLLQPKETHQ